MVTVFENLLPDSDALRRRVAEKVGARGIDAYSLLSIIGRDCVGALQFMAGDDEEIDSTGTIEGEIADEAAIEKILKGLSPSSAWPDSRRRFQDFSGRRTGKDGAALAWRKLA